MIARARGPLRDSPPCPKGQSFSGQGEPYGINQVVGHLSGGNATTGRGKEKLPSRAAEGVHEGSFSL